MKSSKVAICLDDYVALVVVGDKYRVVRNKVTAKAHKAFWRNDRFFVEEIEPSDTFKSIDTLLTK